MKLNLTIPGTPKPKGRPKARVMKAYGKVAAQIYTPKDTREEETRIRKHVSRYMDGKAPLEAPLKVDIVFYLPIPKSYSPRDHKQALAGLLLPAKRPDSDNYEKLLLDACNGLLYVDDGQIVDTHHRKLYSAEPRTEIALEEIITETKAVQHDMFPGAAVDMEA